MEHLKLDFFLILLFCSSSFTTTTTTTTTYHYRASIYRKVTQAGHKFTLYFFLGTRSNIHSESRISSHIYHLEKVLKLHLC